MEKINNRFFAFFDYLRADKKRTLISALIIYTAIFSVIALKIFIPAYNDTGSLLGGDGIASYYPALLQFRRNVIAFFENLSQGNFEFNMLNFAYLFGSDSFAGIYTSMLPMYALTALFPESAIPDFMAWALVITSYMVGLSFMYMCSYFKRDMLWSGFLASFYVFCGNYFYTGLFNPFFLIMNIAFPFMIIGMDRILTEKGWVSLTLSVAWVAIIGFPYLVYTIPFVVVYALIRVYFLYKKTFFRSLGKYFLRGSLSVLLGFALCGFMLLPSLINFFTSERTGGGVTFAVTDLLIPQLGYVTDSFKGEGENLATGLFTMGITCFLYFFIASRTKKEIKCMSFVMLVLIMLPLIRYGLNGFKYDLCRWGFIPALFIIFCCVEYLPRLLRTGRIERRIYIFTLIVYGILFTISQGRAAIIFMLVMALFSNIRVLRKLMFKGARFVKRFFSSSKNKEKKIGSFLSLLLTAVLILAFIFAVFYVIVMDKIIIYPILLTAIIGSVAVVLIASRKNLKSVGCVLLAGLCVFTQLTYSTPVGFDYIRTNNIFVHADHVEHDENMFGRIMSLSDEMGVISEVRETEEFDVSKLSGKDGETTASATSAEGPDELSLQINATLVYDVPTPEAFKSTINGNYMRFLKRCGQDPFSLYSLVVVTGFSLKEVLYSVFGVDGFLTEVESDDFYGFEKQKEVEIAEDKNIYVYKNKYALPIGVTYDSFMSEERFNELNGAELPYAMMDSVYLEGYEPPETKYKEYSRICDYELIQNERGETSFGMTCYDNKIVLNEDVKNNFIYLKFNGFDSCTYTTGMFDFFSVKLDDKKQYNYSVHNNNSDWKWKYTTDMYIFSLGFCEENISEINFISPFEFESLELYAVPEEIYTEAYAERTAEILENTKFSSNTLEGTVDLEKDKTMVISLLYNDSYRAYIDDAEVPVYRANDVFLGINVPAGSHTIRIDYTSPWLYEGLIITFSAAVTIVVLCVVFKKRKKAEEQVSAENMGKNS